MFSSFRCIQIVVLIALSSCKAFDPKLLNPTPVTISPKLPAMENRVQSEVTVVVAPGGSAVAGGSRDLATLFEREVREVLTDPYGEKRGFLELKVTTTKTQIGIGWAVISGLFVFVPNLFGMPISTPKIAVTAQLDVLDNQHRLLSTYRADGEAKGRTALYSSTSYADPGRVLYVQAVRQCLEQIKTKMQPDIARLQTQLK